MIISFLKCLYIQAVGMRVLNMRAVRVQRFGGPEVLQVECFFFDSTFLSPDSSVMIVPLFQVDLNVPVPEVGEEQVMVRVVVAGINPVETYISEGGRIFSTNSPFLLLSGQYSRLPELPYTPGTDAAGFVHQIGRRVNNIKVNCP